MLIGICDDDKVWCGMAEQIIREYGQRHRMTMEIRCFGSSEELLSQTDYVPDVLFLDIVLGKRTGIEAAAQINKKWNGCMIVYLTDFLQYAVDVYYTEHVFYVLKNQFADRVEKIFEKIFLEQERRQKNLLFCLNGGKELILHPGEILYFERRRRITEMFTESGQYTIKDSLDEIMERLPKSDFMRCHNSYIVSFAAIRETRKDSLVMKDGMEIAISRSHKKAVREAFLEWAVLQTD